MSDQQGQGAKPKTKEVVIVGMYNLHVHMSIINIIMDIDLHMIQCPKLRISLMHTSGAGSPKPCTRPNTGAL